MRLDTDHRNMVDMMDTKGFSMCYIAINLPNCSIVEPSVRAWILRTIIGVERWRNAVGC